MALALSGCAPSPINPSFEVSIDAARADLRRMQSDLRPASRPIVVIGGYADPGVVCESLAAELHRCIGPDAKIIPVSVGLCFTMDSARDRLLKCVQDACPSDDPSRTIDVDVVAVSMGGVVARYAAMPREGQRSLRITTLYTFASPHLGAKMAAVPSWESRVVDMRSGSEFLKRLNSAPRDYTIVPYARLGDAIVGARNTAPPDQTPWWVPTPPGASSHLSVYTDERIIADVARRIRGEPTLTHDPPAPLPPDS